jgi:putative nucleotidyltransferase with HDIG domain
MEERERYIQELFPRIREIEDPETRKGTISVWLKALEKSEYIRIEDASQWEPQKEKLQISNVRHTNQVVECALAIADALEKEQGTRIDRDVLIAGAVLHDVDKLLLFNPNTGETTQLGNLFAHTMIGFHMALEAGLSVKIAHAIAAHSSNYSSVEPASVEAIIVYHADHIVTETWKVTRGLDVTFSLPKASR